MSATKHVVYTGKVTLLHDDIEATVAVEGWWNVYDGTFLNLSSLGYSCVDGEGNPLTPEKEVSLRDEVISAIMNSLDSLQQREI